MSIDDWIPTTRIDEDSFNRDEVVELKVSMPVVHVDVPPLFYGKMSGPLRGDVLPFYDSHLRPEEQNDTEYWLGYND